MTSYLAKWLTGFLICAASVNFAEDTTLENSSEYCPTTQDHHRATVRHIEGGGIGYNTGYSTLELFLAPDPQNISALPFLDVRGHIFDNGKWAANAGMGLRGFIEDRIYGMNVYYDYRSTQKLDYNQIGVGFETLGMLWDARINGYFPIGKQVTTPYSTIFAGFSGHNMLINQQYQFAMKGVDAEIGFHLGKSRFFDLYAAVGPYYYVGAVGGNVLGAKARLAGAFNEYITLELSNSYDQMFHNNFQCQLTFTFPFGKRSQSRAKTRTRCWANTLASRMVQPVNREEIIVVGEGRKNNLAIDPTTGLPFFFVFVDNTSHSLGTYESPYPTLALAQANSSPGDIIYVFPGDGTTTGMDSGITLQNNQKFWGSGVSHPLQTTNGNVTIPALSSTSPTITNRNIDTELNAITLAANNAISGFTIDQALSDAIFGIDVQSLDVSSCTFTRTTTYAIEATFPDAASVSITNNLFSNNVNGIILTLNGDSNLICSNNTFELQTSVSSVPIEIVANNHILSAIINNNLITNCETGSIRFSLNSVVDANISILNNTITNNSTGSQATLASSVTIITEGSTDNCLMTISDNTFSGNDSNALYLHTSGAFDTLQVEMSTNTITNNAGSGIVTATPVDTLILLATDNTITNCNDNGISVISSGSTTTGTITISNNTITGIGNASNGIAINQDFVSLDLTISNNEVSGIEGTGIISYSPTGINSLSVNISDNTVTNCKNLSTNAAPGLDLEQFTSLDGTIANNIFTNDIGITDIAVVIGSTLPSPTVCITLTGNDSSTTGYLLSNPVDGTFNVAPCDVASVNQGTINTSGTVNVVQSCPAGLPCVP